MKTFAYIRMALEYLGGSRETPPPGTPRFLESAWVRGLWWGLLAIVILFFSGQKSKFIYIDF